MFSKKYVIIFVDNDVGLIITKQKNKFFNMYEDKVTG